MDQVIVVPSCPASEETLFRVAGLWMGRKAQLWMQEDVEEAIEGGERARRSFY